MNTSAAQKPAGFGRRGRAPSVVSRNPNQPLRTASTSSTGTANVTFEARHAVKFNIVAFGLLLAGGGAVRDLLDPTKVGVFGVPVSDFNQTLAWIGAVGILTIALYWLYMSLARSPAIRMTTSSITAYTFYGVKTVNWLDVDRISTTNDKQYGVVLEVYAKSESPLRFIFKKGFAMPISLTDSTLEEIVAAIRVHRPDLNVA